MAKTRKKKRLIKEPLDTGLDEGELDLWQREVLHHDGNLALRAGRQVGKSFIIAKKAFKFACENPGVEILVIAAAQRESSFIFEKIQSEFLLLKDEGKDYFLEKPTQTKIKLINGSVIRSLPTGRTGYYIRGQTLDLLIADEAAYIPEEVWISVIPMIAVSRKVRGFGYVWLLSTPWGCKGYFYEAFNNPEFKTWHISAETCERIDKKLLEIEKIRLPKNIYRQEWLGEFVNDLNKFFSYDVINNCLIKHEEVNLLETEKNSKFFLGVDVARYGGDENAFVVVELKESGLIVVKEIITTERKAITDTFLRIEQLNLRYSFNRILIDDAGIGGGLTDFLISKYRSKIVGLGNKRKSIEGGKRKILKEDLYSETLLKMEQRKVIYERDLKLLKSLNSIEFEYTEYKNLRIFGDYSHIVEALVRAIWGVREKRLRLFVRNI